MLLVLLDLLLLFVSAFVIAAPFCANEGVQLAATLQYGAPARIARFQASGPGGLRTGNGYAGGSETPTSIPARAGVEAVNALKCHLVHSVAADQTSSFAVGSRRTARVGGECSKLSRHHGY